MRVVWEYALAAKNYGVLYEWLQLLLGNIEVGLEVTKAAKEAAREVGL